MGERQRRLVTLVRTRVLCIDYNICPRNPGLPAESAKPVNYIMIIYSARE